jgi:hypothetical protein
MSKARRQRLCGSIRFLAVCGIGAHCCGEDVSLSYTHLAGSLTTISVWLTISCALRASVQTEAADRASFVVRHSTVLVTAPRVPIAHTFDSSGEYFEINPTRFIGLRRIALRMRDRLFRR